MAQKASPAVLEGIEPQTLPRGSPILDDLPGLVGVELS